MFNKLDLLLAVTILVMISMSVPASAFVVTSSVNGIEVDSGGFEGEVVGGAPSKASVGSYGSTLGVTVTDAAAEGISGSPDGTKFIKNSNGVFNAVMAGVTSGTIHAEFSAYIPEQSSGDGNTMLILTGNGGYPGRFGAWVGFSNPDDWTHTSHSLESGQAGIFNRDGAWHNTMTDNGARHMTAPYDKWLDISVDINVDNSKYTITVDGITSDPMDFTTGGSTAVNVFEIRENVGNYEGYFYLDSRGDQEYHELQIQVNEPGASGLISPSAGSYSYSEGSSVELNAMGSYFDIANGKEYTFDHWETDGESVAVNQITITMDRQKVAKAFYIISEPALELSGRWELFIDDYVVSSSTNVIRTLHQPVKNAGGPVVRPDKPWDISPYYNSVIYDEEESVYKMWYMTYNYGQPLPERTPILYATSSDGINWDKPELGLFNFDGSTDNNIVLLCYGYHDLYCPSVVKDSLDADPGRRYKMIYWDYPNGPETYGDAGMCVAFSPDGISWTRYPNNPVLYAQQIENSISDVMDVMYDSAKGKFVVYAKGWAAPWPLYRLIVRTESEDFINWTTPEPVLRHAFDTIDPQSYGMPVGEYEGLYVGLLRSYKKPGDETIDIQLTVSHDNKRWNRVADMATFLPLGEAGTWDDGMLFSSIPIVRGDSIEIFYGGWDGPHNTNNRRAQIGVARLRKDGFVSLDAGSSPAYVTTRKLKGVCGGLYVNVNALGGWLKAEVLDAAGNVLPGYSLDECAPVTSDEVNKQVRWRTKGQLPTSDEPLRLRFVLQNASLYSFVAGKYSESTAYCGDYCHQYPVSDTSGPLGESDCLVNFYDFTMVAGNWKGFYNINKLLDIAVNWLDDTRP